MLTGLRTIDINPHHKNVIVKASHRKHPIHNHHSHRNKAHRDNLRPEFISKSSVSEIHKAVEKHIQQYVSVKQSNFRKQNDQQRIPVRITNRKQLKETTVQLNSTQREPNSIKSSNALLETKYNKTKNEVFRMESKWIDEAWLRYYY